MAFNPIRFEISPMGKSDTTNELHECTYVTPNQCSLPKDDKLNFMNVNIRSLSKKFEKLEECIKLLNHDLTVIGVSETHLKENPEKKFHLPGYKLECVHRVGRQKGGVCMYISDKIKYKLRKDFCNANSNYESCFIEIENMKTKNAIVGVIYRAHTAINDFLSDIDPVFHKINAENKPAYIMGDFNIDLLKVDSDKAHHDYLDLIYSYSLIPTIYKPTRITETTATIIDNILTNDVNIVKAFILITNLSDHLPNILSTSKELNGLQSEKQKVTYKRKHTNENVSKFKQKLSEVNWQERLNNINADDDYKKFVNIFNDIYDECVPLRKCSGNRKKEPKLPWITKGLLKSINNKNKLYKQYLSKPNPDRLQKFKTYRNKLHTLIRKSKRKYFFNKFERVKNDMKQTWKIINNIIGRSKNRSFECKFKTNDGNIITNPQHICNHFNDFFVNVGPELASKIHHSGKDYFDYLNYANVTTNSMYFKPIVEKEIVKIIGKFNPNKSAGHDNIGNYIIKNVAPEIAKPLAMIFNLSISTGIVPENLKKAKVIPIYKKEDSEVFSNYRPVSILPCFSKVLER